MDADGKACLVSGAVPEEDGSLRTAEVSVSPAGYTAAIGQDAGFTSSGNTFAIVVTGTDEAGGLATPETSSRQVTLTLRSLPQITFTQKG